MHRRINTSEGRYPLQQRIEDKKRGIGRQRYPFVAWILTAVMVGVMIYELVYNYREQKQVFSFKVSAAVPYSLCVPSLPPAFPTQVWRNAGMNK